MEKTFLMAVLSFASTNMDDIFVLMILYTQVRDRRGVTQIIAGQYLGIGCLTGASALGAMGTRAIPSQYVRLLGFLPLFLAIRSWADYRRGRANPEEEVGEPKQIRFLGAAVLKIANGADNIGVYIPIFSGYSHADYAVTLLVFVAMTALWCYLGFFLAKRPYIKKIIAGYQHILAPLVLTILGILILLPK